MLAGRQYYQPVTIQTRAIKDSILVDWKEVRMSVGTWIPMVSRSLLYPDLCYLLLLYPGMTRSLSTCVASADGG